MELINKSNYKELKKIIENQLFKKVLVVGGSYSFVNSGAKKIIYEFLKNKEKYVFLKKKKLPEINELLKLNKATRIFNPDLIISVGGGSVMDLAKISNVTCKNNNLKNQILDNSVLIEKEHCKHIAIPTTAGSGAEVTTNAVIYVDNTKYSVEHELIKPTYMALFPELIIKNNKLNIIQSSAFDSFAQAVESMFSVKSTSESLLNSKKSIKFFLSNYKKFISNKNLENAYKLSLSSYYSGKAISISKTIAPHAVSYPFTSLFNVDHGHAVSLTFNSFLKFNYESKAKSVSKYDLVNRYNLLFKYTNSKNMEDLSNQIDQIKLDLSLESKLSKINRKIPGKLNLILDGINIQRLNNNPIKIQKKNILNILKKIV